MSIYIQEATALPSPPTSLEAGKQDAEKAAEEVMAVLTVQSLQPRRFPEMQTMAMTKLY